MKKESILLTTDDGKTAFVFLAGEDDTVPLENETIRDAGHYPVGRRQNLICCQQRRIQLTFFEALCEPPESSAADNSCL